MQTLTDDQRERWQTDGYLHLEGVLGADEVALFADELDRIRLLPGYEPGGDQLGHYSKMDTAKDTDPEGFMDRRILLDYGQHFVDLIDRPSVFDLIVDIMGPHIMLSMTQAIVRPSTDTFPGYTHTDGGEGLREIRVTESSPPLAMKAMYLLSDVHGDDAGAFTVYPGSHMRKFPWQRDEALTPHSPGAVQLPGRAGDCYLFPHALWHGPAPNHSGSYVATTTKSRRRSTPNSLRDSDGFSETSGTASVPARTSTCQPTRRPSSTKTNRSARPPGPVPRSCATSTCSEREGPDRHPTSGDIPRTTKSACSSSAFTVASTSSSAKPLSR